MSKYFNRFKKDMEDIYSKIEDIAITVCDRQINDIDTHERSDKDREDLIKELIDQYLSEYISKGIDTDTIDNAMETLLEDIVNDEDYYGDEDDDEDEYM